MCRIEIFAAQGLIRSRVRQPAGSRDLDRLGVSGSLALGRSTSAERSTDPMAQPAMQAAVG